MPVSTKRDKIKSQPPVVAYIRCSSAGQVESGLGLQAQRHAIETHAARQGLVIDRWATDEAVSGSVHPLRRPALSDALSAVRGGGVLLVAKADRVARKAADLLELRDLAERERWTLASADGSVDWSTAHGRAMSTVMGAFAELERDLIRQRTREALRAKIEAGQRMGPPVQLAQDVRERVAEMRTVGMTMAAIAAQLNADGTPTARGGRWYPSTVRCTLVSLERDTYAAARRAP